MSFFRLGSHPIIFYLSLCPSLSYLFFECMLVFHTLTFSVLAYVFKWRLFFLTRSLSICMFPGTASSFKPYKTYRPPIYILSYFQAKPGLGPSPDPTAPLLILLSFWSSCTHFSRSPNPSSPSSTLIFLLYLLLLFLLYSSLFLIFLLFVSISPLSPPTCAPRHVLPL